LEWTVEGVVVIVFIIKRILLEWASLFDIRFSFKDLESFQGEVIEMNQPQT